MSEATFGKYRLIAELGHGGMADVFLAVIAGPAGSNFSKLTVVKRLRQNLAEEPEFVEMLVDEARISARLNHPNVVQTNEVGSVGNQYFLAMEYLDGQPLHRIQHRAAQAAAKALKTPPNGAQVSSTPPPPSVTPPPSSVMLTPSDPFPRECQYLVIADTLAGLHHAHELADYDGSPLQIVHRDVTPHNVFVTYEGQVKVVDFGIAKAVGRASETRQGVVKGKVRYMAPEQAIGQAVDRRADVFSVGIMLWEAATGRRMWKDMDDLMIVQVLISGAVKSSPREVDPTVPEAIDRICQKALAPRAEDRYASAEEMRLDLEQYLSDSGMIVAARRKLGASVSALFADKRQEIRAIIERQLQALKAQPSEVEPLNIPLDANSSGQIVALGPVASSGALAVSVRPSDVPSAVRSNTDLSAMSSGPHSASNSTSTQARKPMSKLPIFAVAAGVLLGVGAIALARTSASRADQKPTTAGSTSLAAADAPPSEVHVKLTTSPANATIKLDGVIVPSPYDARLPRDAREHTINVEAPGYEPRVEKVKLESDVVMVLTLTKPAAKPTQAPQAALQPPPSKWTPAPKQAPTAPPSAVTAAPAVTPTPPPTPTPTPSATQHPGGNGKVPKPDIDKGDPWGGGR